MSLEFILSDKEKCRELPEKVLSMLEEMRLNNEKIESMLDVALNYRRLMEGKLILQEEQIVFSDFLSNLVVMLKVLHNGSEVKSFVDWKSLPGTIYGDQYRIEQVCLLDKITFEARSCV